MKREEWKKANKFRIIEHHIRTSAGVEYQVEELLFNSKGQEFWKLWEWNCGPIGCVRMTPDTYSSIKEAEDRIKREIKARTCKPKVVKEIE